jgi:Pyruvate/2-oxoacid:ferredoxin oxidoreductase gamma subunit
MHATMEVYVLVAGDHDQGILYMSQMLLEAVMEGGWHASCVWSRTQGPITQCLMAISDAPLDAPHYAAPDIVVLASREAADQLEFSVRRGGLLLMNASRLQRPPRRHDADVILVPTEPDGGEADPVRASMILLGALIGLTGWVSPELARRVVERGCRDRALCEAFSRGVSYVSDLGRTRAAEPAFNRVWD